MEHYARPLVRRLGVVTVAGAAGFVAFSAIATSSEREAGACSCGGPDIALVAPERVDDAPLNAKVRIDAPSAGAVTPGASGPILRVHDGGRVVPSTSRTIAPGGSSSSLEITPTSALAPSTQYEIAMLDPSRVPATIVIGTFKTGTTLDTTAPRLDSVGNVSAYKNVNASGSSCQVPGPWVTIDGLRAEDPGRPNAQLVYGVWLGDAAGNVDTKKPPTSVQRLDNGRLHVGQTSLCDPNAFPIPKAPIMWLGIAAIDEAGNTSPARRVRVDLAGARQY